jgi:predicted transcriptional regulator/transcriptional regulator with XRE-family HTH domain
MVKEPSAIGKGVYLGPRLRRLRRELGLTQMEMAGDLEVSPSYIALMERNQRPVTAEVLLKLARAYTMDLSDLAGDDTADHAARLRSLLKDPLFADIDIHPGELGDIVSSFPGFSEAMLRLSTAHREAQLALADNRPSPRKGLPEAVDPLAATRRFLAARRNCFPALDAMAERLAAKIAEKGGMQAYLLERHSLRVRRMPPEVMSDSLRRHDRHRRDILLDTTMSAASQTFQLAIQLSHLEFGGDIASAVKEGGFTDESSTRIATRALASYCAAAMVMPYAAFAKAVDSCRYDVEWLSRQFGVSFEQAAHRLTTLQKPGQEKVPFFFIRVDVAGNVSKRLEGAHFPFAVHGCSCPLWSLHHVFRRPDEVLTQWLEFPDGQRFFSIARTVSTGGGAFGEPRVEHAIALVCEARHADRLVYHQPQKAEHPTPVGTTCRLCHRINCAARAEPPIGRQIIGDEYRRTRTPFGFSDA